MCVDRVTARVKERDRERELKGEDRRRKGGIPEIITQENTAKLLHYYYIANKIYILFFFCYKITEI